MPSEINETQKENYCMILCVQSKNVKVTEVKSRMEVTRGGEVEEMGGHWLEDTKFQLWRIISSRNQAYIMMTIVNNAVLYTVHLIKGIYQVHSAHTQTQ